MAMATGDHEAAMATGATKDAQMELENQLLGSEGSASPKSDGDSSHTSSTADALTDMTIGGKSMRLLLQQDVEDALAGDDDESDNDDVERPAAYVAARARATVEAAVGMRVDVSEDDVDSDEDEKVVLSDDDALEDEATDWASDVTDELKGAKMLRGKRVDKFTARLASAYKTKKRKGKAVLMDNVIIIATNCKKKKQKEKGEQKSESEDLVDELVQICEQELARSGPGNYQRKEFKLCADPLRDLTAIIDDDKQLFDILQSCAMSEKGATLVATFNKMLIGRIILAKRQRVVSRAGWDQLFDKWLVEMKMAPHYANHCSIVAGLSLCIPNIVLHSRFSRICHAPKQFVAAVMRRAKKNEGKMANVFAAPFNGADVAIDDSKLNFVGFKGQPLHKIKEYLPKLFALHHSMPTESQKRMAFPLYNVALPKKGDAEEQLDAVRDAKRLKKAVPKFVREFPAGRKLTEEQVSAMKSVMQVETVSGDAVVMGTEVEVTAQLIQHFDKGKKKNWSIKNFSLPLKAQCGIVLQAYQNAMLTVLPLDNVDVQFVAIELNDHNRGNTIESTRNIDGREIIGQFVKNGIAHFQIHVTKGMQAMAEPVELTGLPPPDDELEAWIEELEEEAEEETELEKQRLIVEQQQRIDALEKQVTEHQKRQVELEQQVKAVNQRAERATERADTAGLESQVTNLKIDLTKALNRIKALEPAGVGPVVEDTVQ